MSEPVDQGAHTIKDSQVVVDRVDILGAMGGGGEPNPTPTSGPTPTTQPTNSPTPKPADLTGDNKIDGADLALLIKNYKKANPTHAEGDVDDNGVIDIIDLSKLVKAWGS